MSIWKILAGILLLAPIAARSQSMEERSANTVILDETGVRNLGIETVLVSERTFEQTVFAIGILEEIPQSRSVISSRIAGRVVGLDAFVGDKVAKGQVLVEVESRQPGDPPPVINLKAPLAGLIVDSHVRLGEPVEPDEELMDISDRSQLWAVAKIPELEAARIVPGTKARIRIPAVGGEPIEVTLKRYGVEANRKAGAVEGIFEIPNTEGRLQPGMRAEFSVITGTRDHVMSVPRTAIQGDPARRVVFIEDFELPNAYIRSPVVLGEENDGFVEVISGVFPGDTVVTRGSYGLSFAGGGSGMSLKEALDAAHGHEHNEDGSEMSAEQLAAREAAKRNAGGGGAGGASWLIVSWAVAASVACLILAQLWWSGRRKRTVPATN